MRLSSFGTSSISSASLFATILLLFSTQTFASIESLEDSEDSDNDFPIDPENLVGYGEDCSREGPFCDIRKHLICDKEEEVCICNDKEGYVHVGNLETLASVTSLLDEEENSENDGQAKIICMKSLELEYKLERMLNITKKLKNFGDILLKYKKYLPKKYQDLFKEEVIDRVQ